MSKPIESVSPWKEAWRRFKRHRLAYWSLWILGPHPPAAAALTADALRSYARQHLAPHKVPGTVVFVDEIPRTGPGRFKKPELIRLLTAPRDG